VYQEFTAMGKVHFVGTEKENRLYWNTTLPLRLLNNGDIIDIIGKVIEPERSTDMAGDLIYKVTGGRLRLGLETNVISAKHVTIITNTDCQNKCICDIMLLIAQGCQCGAINREET
jgi:hypothetical protein